MTDKRIRIILDNSQAKRGAKETDDALKGVGRSADRAQFSINRLAAAIATVISVQKVIQYADAWTNVQNQLRQTTSSQQELIRTSDEIVAIAKLTRTELEGTAQLYTRFRLSIDETVISDERLLSVIETVNKQLALSGATAEEAAGALRQLSQGIAAGALRGEEFNSVAEQAPGILRAVSEETGLAIGELRKFAAEGGITSDLLIRSLENYKTVSDEAFAGSAATISQSLQVARTSAIQFIGALDDATGASSGLASAIISLSEYVSSPEFISGIISAFETSVLTIDAASDAVGDFSNEIQLASDIGGGAIAKIGEAFKNILPNIRGLVQIITVELAAGIEKLLVSANALFEVFSNPFDRDSTSAAMDFYDAEIQRINTVRMESIELVLAERDAIISTAEASAKLRIEEANRRKEERANRVLPGASGGPGGLPSVTTSDTGQKEIAQAQNVTKLLQNELNTRLQIADIYRQQTLSRDQSLYEQKLAAIAAREAEELAMVESKAVEDQIRRDEQFRQALENDKIKEEERIILRQEQAAQQLLAEQITEEQRTAILQEGIRARMDLDKAEAQARLANAGALGNALMSLGQGQSKKIFKIGQTLALAQAAVALPTAVLESFKNGGGYPWGLVPAGAMLATGLKNIQQIKSAGAGLGGGGGGSISTPSLGSGGGGSSPQIPSNTNTPELQQQRRIIELRGVSPGDLLTGEQVASIFESDDSVIVAFESARNDAQRRNVIGVTAR